MKTTWVWSVESEANRLLQTLHNIGNGFYTTHNFSVVSHNDPYSPTSVQLPALDYQSITDLWTHVRDVDIESLPASDPNNLTPELKVLLTDIKMPEKSISQDLWQKHQSIILRAVHRELPNMPSINSLTIYPTYFGTQVSFNNTYSDNANIIVYLRIDATLHHLVEAIISSLLRPLHDLQGFSWSESEAIIDHLTTNSNLANLLRHLDPNLYEGTISPLQKSSNSSSDFLSIIGAPVQNHVFTTTNNIPLVDHHPLHHLTERENIVLCRLISSPNKTITYDEIADIIFQSDDEYSLSVIGKVIERLRTKLEKNGISGSLIVTDRKSGYYIQN